MTPGDGTIDVAELMKFVQRGNNNLADELRFTEEVVDALDKDGDGSISRYVVDKAVATERVVVPVRNATTRHAVGTDRLAH